MGELNPEHPVTRATTENAHKFIALLVKRLGGKVTITSEEILALHRDNVAVMSYFKNDSIDLELMPMETSIALAAIEEANRKGAPINRA